TELEPPLADAWGALGIALLRQRAFSEAMAALEKAKSLRADRNDRELLCLVVAKARTGDAASAKQLFNEINARIARRCQVDDKLRALRDEASSALNGIR